jgi:hypothetical protein
MPTTGTLALKTEGSGNQYDGPPRMTPRTSPLTNDQGAAAI